VVKTLAALLAAAGLACAAAPASTPTPAVPHGVTAAGVVVGGLSAEPARAALEAAFARPLRVAGGGTIDPARLGLRVDVQSAVSAALGATEGSRIAVPARWSKSRLDRTVAALAKHVDRAPVKAAVIGAIDDRPTFSPARPGVRLDRAATAAAIARALRDGTRAPVRLVTRPVAPPKPGLVIVVTRGENSLRLFDGKRLVRTFSVATGQAIYPTPSGIWKIMDKQRDPWWYPPTYDAWAKGLSPVPPGPGNPLGTRWMGLNAPGVGIHGTDEPTSIGYSASHGCIRMQVPDAEWLFDRVTVGTPVVIL
jgi:lipoprotein-anchoring transpeptidase ErfK/SrfK